MASAGLALRLVFLFCCARVTTDSQFYADIAKNWLNLGIYGLTDSGVVVPTLTRLPGSRRFSPRSSQFLDRITTRRFSSFRYSLISELVSLSQTSRGAPSPIARRKLFFFGGSMPILGELCLYRLNRDIRDFLHRIGSGLRSHGPQRTSQTYDTNRAATRSFFPKSLVP